MGSVTSLGELADDGEAWPRGMNDPRSTARTVRQVDERVRWPDVLLP